MKKESTMPWSPKAVLYVAMLAAACASNVAACSTTEKTQAAPPSSHMVVAASLKEVMRGFDDAVRRHVPADTDVHDRWEGVFPKIAAAASALKIAAKDLAGHPPKGLEIPARGRFQVLGQTLVDAAADLQEVAESGDADGVRIARARVGTACRDCHERYRPDSPGVPEAFR